MSDERTPESTEPIDSSELIDEFEERAMLEALEALEAGHDSVSDRARPYLETLASLPAALEPVAPSSAVKRELLAAVDGDARGAEVVDFAPRTPAAEPRRGIPVWAMRIAALLALALLGVSALQYSQLSDQEERIALQEAEIERLQAELQSVLPALDRRPPEWMAARGTELCELKPRHAAGEPQLEGEDGSRGWLFVRQDHQHWFVTLEGLAQAPDGHVYELWFRVDGEMVSGGRFSPDTDGRAMLTSETMPSPITGIGITLEPDDGDSGPSETMVLWGDEVMLVL